VIHYQGVLQLYIDWLHTGEILEIEGDVSPFPFNEHDCQAALLEAWAIAAKLEDIGFKHAIIATIIKNGLDSQHTGLGHESIRTSHGRIHQPEIQRFVAEAFLVSIDAEWYDAQAHKFNKDFTLDLARAAVRAMGKKSTHKALLEKYTEGS
jgi:hypothetical protein